MPIKRNNSAARSTLTGDQLTIEERDRIRYGHVPIDYVDLTIRSSPANAPFGNLSCVEIPSFVKREIIGGDDRTT